MYQAIGIRVATTPKLLDEAFALVVSGQFLECLPLFVGDDVGDVFVEPVFVGFFQFGLYVACFGARVLLLLLFLCEHAWAGSEK